MHPDEPQPRAGESIETRRRRLRFRSWHRGTKEMDLLLGRFADAALDGLTTRQLDAYEALLREPDPDVYGWIVRQVAPPADKTSDVLTMIIDFYDTR